MKLKIDTNTKTIQILEETSILELVNFLKEKELTEYKLISSFKEIEYIGYVYITNPLYPPTIVPPYIVTC